jgi:predicted GIY-YIG superfamily endonuclease
MAKDPATLRKRFARKVSEKWIMNEHPPQSVSAVYVILAFGVSCGFFDIQYVGSTTNMEKRYRSHKVPKKVQDSGYMNILYYLPMESGFYDYELKLIRKLKPKYNKQHKGA